MNAQCEEAKLDGIGILLANVLAYQDHCEGIWKTRRQPEPGSYAWKISTLKRHARAAFRRLIVIGKERQQWGWDLSAAQYFWEILPYQEFELRIEKTSDSDDEVKHGKPLAACLIAIELNSVQSLLAEDPAKWKERRIFSEENKHADIAWRDLEFQGAYRRLCSEHKSLMGKIRAAQGAGQLLADFTFLDCNPEQDLKSEEDEFHFDFAQLCDDYSLEGISPKKPYAMPQRLRFQFESTSLVIRLPHYFKVDLNRCLPLNVIKMLQAREYPIFSKPPLASQPLSREHWYDDIDRKKYVARYYELVKEHKNSRAGLVMFKVYVDLHSEFTKEGLQYNMGSRARYARYLLKLCDVPPKRKDPKIQAW